MGRLENKVAIVTGASSGMGEEISKLFAKEGAKVVAIARRKEKLQDVIDGITAAGGTAIAVAGDVSKEEDVQNTVKTAVEKFDKLDIVVNNAGIFDHLLSVADVDDETWQQVFDVNVTGPMRFIRAAIPEMLKNPGDNAGFNRGVFVNVGSIASQCGLKGGAAYSASKHAILGLSKNTATMFANKGIRSNVIAPGFVETEMAALLSSIDPDRVELLMSCISHNPRNGKPEEIAELAVYLASDGASFVNGAIVAADGGLTAF